MIANDQELQSSLARIAWFQQQVSQLRKTEANPVNYRAASSGFLAEIDRMQLDVREYFGSLPTEREAASSLPEPGQTELAAELFRAYDAEEAARAES